MVLPMRSSRMKKVAFPLGLSDSRQPTVIASYVSGERIYRGKASIDAYP